MDPLRIGIFQKVDPLRVKFSKSGSITSKNFQKVDPLREDFPKYTSIKGKYFQLRVKGL